MLKEDTNLGNKRPVKLRHPERRTGGREKNNNQVERRWAAWGSSREGAGPHFEGLILGEEGAAIESRRRPAR